MFSISTSLAVSLLHSGIIGILNSESQEELDELAVDFTASHSHFGSVETVELEHGGEGKMVTMQNRTEFVDKMCSWHLTGISVLGMQLATIAVRLYSIITLFLTLRPSPLSQRSPNYIPLPASHPPPSIPPLTTATHPLTLTPPHAGCIEQQLQSIKTGFHSLLPMKQIGIFSPHELEVLLSGQPTIDVKSIRTRTTYRDYSPNANIVKWLWEILERYSEVGWA